MEKFERKRGMASCCVPKSISNTRTQAGCVEHYKPTYQGSSVETFCIKVVVNFVESKGIKSPSLQSEITARDGAGKRPRAKEGRTPSFILLILFIVSILSIKRSSILEILSNCLCRDSYSVRVIFSNKKSSDKDSVPIDLLSIINY